MSTSAGVRRQSPWLRLPTVGPGHPPSLTAHRPSAKCRTSRHPPALRPPTTGSPHVLTHESHGRSVDRFSRHLASEGGAARSLGRHGARGLLSMRAVFPVPCGEPALTVWQGYRKRNASTHIDTKCACWRITNSDLEEPPG